MKNQNFTYIGKQINGLKIIDYNSNGKRQYFTCICVCDKEFIVRTDRIKSGAVKSCGCLTSELMSNSHTLPNNLGAINKLFANYKSTAIRKSLVFNLSIDEFKIFINKNCFYCGIEPQQHQFLGSNNKYKYLKYNGIDRLNNNVGYTIDNCVPCCTTCNGAKSNSSLEDFQNWIKRLIAFNIR